MPRADTGRAGPARSYHRTMAGIGVRRALFRWQFAAAAVLPLWVLVGAALFGASVPGFLGVLLLAPVVLLVQLGLALLFSARAGVRRAKALDGPAIGVLTAFQVGVVGFGFFGPATAWFGVLAAVAAIGGFWLGGWLLVTGVRTRVRTMLAGFPPPQPRRPIDAGEYVVVKPSQR